VHTDGTKDLEAVSSANLVLKGNASSTGHTCALTTLYIADANPTVLSSHTIPLPLGIEFLKP
jgi:hypothetical protein